MSKKKEEEMLRHYLGGELVITCDCGTVNRMKREKMIATATVPCKSCRQPLPRPPGLATREQLFKGPRKSIDELINDRGGGTSPIRKTKRAGSAFGSTNKSEPDNGS